LLFLTTARGNYSEEPSRNISESRVEIAIRDPTGSPAPSDSSTFKSGTEIDRTNCKGSCCWQIVSLRHLSIHLKLIDSNFKNIEPFFSPEIRHERKEYQYSFFFKKLKIKFDYNLF